ncbi:hypothetical protein Plhal304r1_c020g0070751 [Plasmopara halstedii]
MSCEFFILPGFVLSLPDFSDLKTFPSFTIVVISIRFPGSPQIHIPNVFLRIHDGALRTHRTDEPFQVVSYFPVINGHSHNIYILYAGILPTYLSSLSYSV